MKTKECSRCKEPKPLKDFNWKNKSKGIRAYYCRDCSREYIKQHYENNKSYYVEKAARHNKKYHKKAQEWFLSYFAENHCIDCDEPHPAALQFDHVRGNKIASVSRMLSNYSSLEAIKAEIAKCEVRCANCHMKKTAKQFGWYTADL